MAVPPVGQMPEPLRLPHGSVRGAIAIVVAAAYGYALVFQKTVVPTVLVNAVVVVIAFYFGSHATSTAATVPGQTTPHRPRLFRILLFLGFAGLTAWFLVHDPSLQGIPTALVAVLEVLGGYILGATASWLVHRRAHESHGRVRLGTTSIVPRGSPARRMGLSGMRAAQRVRAGPMLELRTRCRHDRPRSEPHPARATVALYRLRRVERDRSGR